MNKVIKFILKSLLFFAALFLAGYLAMAIYINLHQQDIINKVSNKIENEINGKVEIEDISLSFFRNFPKISVLLSNVVITDIKSDSPKTPFFKGKQVFVSIDIPELLKKNFSLKEIKIDDAKFNVYTDSTGYTNAYLFKLKDTIQKPGSAEKKSNPIKRVVLKDIGIQIDDREKNKFYDLFTRKLAVNIDNSDTALLLSVRAHLLINKFILIPGGRNFLEGQKVDGNFDLLYDKDLQLLHTDSMDLKIGGKPFNLNFTIDMESPAPKFQLKINKGSIPFADVRSFLGGYSGKN